MRVVKQYNWKGELNAYIWNNSTVPIDCANGHYQMIIEAISKGTCTVEEPIITQVTKAYTEAGDHSGYFTQFGFLPIDETNELYKLVKTSIENEICIEIEPENICLPQIKSIIACIVFDTPWMGADGRCDIAVNYSHARSNSPREYNVSIFNLPNNGSSSKWDILIDNYKIDKKIRLASPHLFGVITIEVPLKELTKIIKKRSEKTHWLYEIEEQHLLATGRGSKGVTTNFIANYFKDYFTNIIQDIGNGLIEAFSREYGVIPIGYIDDWKVREDTIVIHRTENGAFNMGNFGLQCGGYLPPNNLNEGLGVKSVFDPESCDNNISSHIKSKVRLYLKRGMHMEAVCLMSSYLEMKYASLLLYWASSDSVWTQKLISEGYRGHLKIVSEIVARVLTHLHNICDDKVEKNLLTCLQNAKELYQLRNDYLHSFILPGMRDGVTPEVVKMLKPIEGTLYAHQLIKHPQLLFSEERKRIEALLEPFCDVWTDGRVSSYEKELMTKGRFLLEEMKDIFLKEKSSLNLSYEVLERIKMNVEAEGYDSIEAFIEAKAGY